MQYHPISTEELGIKPAFNSKIPTRKAFEQLSQEIIIQNVKTATLEELTQKKVLLKALRQTYGMHFTFKLFPDVLIVRGDGIASPIITRQAWRVKYTRKSTAPFGLSKRGNKLYSLSEETFIEEIVTQWGGKFTISGLKIPR